MKKTAFKKILIDKNSNLFATVKRFGLPVATVVAVILIVVIAFSFKNNPVEERQLSQNQPTPTVLPPNILPLPSPDSRSNTSVEAALKSRRTRRDIKPDELSLKQVGQMLWAAQGVTTNWGGRTAPSAKSTYPLSVYLITYNVEKLESGLYKYIPGDRVPAHQITPLKLADFKSSVFAITNQSSTKDPAAIIVITGDMQKMADAYGGEKHDKEVYLEAGHATENLYLQAESLKLGLVAISSFDEIKIRNLLSIPANETIIYLVPFGYPKE